MRALPRVSATDCLTRLGCAPCLRDTAAAADDDDDVRQRGQTGVVASASSPAPAQAAAAAEDAAERDAIELVATVPRRRAGSPSTLESGASVSSVTAALKPSSSSSISTHDRQERDGERAGRAIVVGDGRAGADNGDDERFFRHRPYPYGTQHAFPTSHTSHGWPVPFGARQCLKRLSTTKLLAYIRGPVRPDAPTHVRPWLGPLERDLQRYVAGPLASRYWLLVLFLALWIVAFALLVRTAYYQSSTSDGGASFGLSRSCSC